MITLIAAVAKNGVIGNGNTIPWHLPEDFKHFKETTEGHTVIMGSKTWFSLPTKFRPLPNRFNIVVSRDRHSHNAVDGDAVTWVDSIERALAFRIYRGVPGPDTAAELPMGSETFIIGGASLYEQTIELADRLIISHVDLEPEGDTYFPSIGEEWKIVSELEKDGFKVVEYQRVA